MITTRKSTASAESAGYVYANKALGLVPDVDTDGKRIVTIVLHTDMAFERLLELLEGEDTEETLRELTGKSGRICMQIHRSKESIAECLHHHLPNIKSTNAETTDHET